MTVMTQFVGVIMSAITAFTGTYVAPNVRPAPEIPGTVIQQQIDEATQEAHGSGLSTGIAVIDRAKNNLMKTNDEEAHRQYKMESAGRLPILLYVARIDPAVGKGDVPDVTAMMQGVSGEATQRLWDEHGGSSIIADVAKRYNLQETSAGATWRDTTSSAVDIGRMYRRFLDDEEVSIETKKYVIELLRNTSLSVVNEDFSFGLPNTLNVESMSNNKEIAWVQGWSPSGSDPMIRTTSGVLGGDMRYIIVVTGQASDPEMPNEAANIAINGVASTLIGTGSGGGDYFNADDKDSDEDRIEEFRDKQAELYGEEFISSD